MIRANVTAPIIPSKIADNAKEYLYTT